MTLYLLYLVGLFFALTPGVLFTFPVKGTYKVALAHAFLFGLLYYLIDEASWMAEGFVTHGKLTKCPNGGVCLPGFRCGRGGLCVTPQRNSGGPKMQKCANGKFCGIKATCGKGVCTTPQITPARRA